jgi:hypothetical protein
VRNNWINPRNIHKSFSHADTLQDLLQDYAMVGWLIGKYITNSHQDRHNMLVEVRNITQILSKHRQQIESYREILAKYR